MKIKHKYLPSTNVSCIKFSWLPQPTKYLNTKMLQVKITQITEVCVLLQQRKLTTISANLFIIILIFSGALFYDTSLLTVVFSICESSGREMRLVE